MEEIWKQVEENPDYLISNQNGWKNTKTIKQPKGRNKRGYRCVGLGRKLGERQYHILVAKAFPEICGEWFEGCVVHHINFNKLDNRPENLIVLSHTEHSKLHYLTTLPDSYKKASDKRSKSISKALKGRRAIEKHIPVVQLTPITYQIVKEWDCITDIQKELGYSAGNICMACKGQISKAYGYIWKYKKDVISNTL